MKQIAIVGAGFSGVAVAWNLLRRATGPVRITLFSKEQGIGRGLAYGSPSPHHLLNVPAGRMGIDPEDQGGFLRYLQQMGLPFQSGEFAPRSLYGSYLEYSLGRERSAALDRGVELRIQFGAVESISFLEHSRHTLRLTDGQGYAADAVVLALGNFPPCPPDVNGSQNWSLPGLYSTPWNLADLNLLHPRAPVLLIGSGLTAFDVTLQLRHQGHRGVITMFSRRGLLAQSHRNQEHPPEQGLVPPAFLSGVTSASVMLRETRKLVRLAKLTGQDWRDVIGGLRQSTVRLWQQLPRPEQQRFLRHLLPYWDTHRHRAAVPIASMVDREIGSGAVELISGRLENLTENANATWQADIRLRGATQIHHWKGDAVINCTGPSSDLLRAAKSEPLIRTLLAAGRIAPDSLSLGVEVDTKYRLVDCRGNSQSGIYYVGPMLKARFWEATAVPELRLHARALSDIVIECL